MKAEERAHELLFDYCRHGNGEDRRIAGSDCVECLTDQIRSAERAATLAERERCAEITEAEPEMDGPMPLEFLYEFKKAFETGGTGSLEECLRAIVRVTKRNIAAAIRSDPTEEGNG